MPINYRCPSCHEQLRAPVRSAGRYCRCPACHYVSTVPRLNETKVVKAELIDQPIEVVCPHCDARLQTKTSLLGTTGLCRGCGNLLEISLSHPTRKTSLPTKFAFSCPHCSSLFQGNSAMEGKQGRCSKCQSVFEIRRYRPPSTATANSQLVSAVLVDQDTPTSPNASNQPSSSQPSNRQPSGSPTDSTHSRDSNAKSPSKSSPKVKPNGAAKSSKHAAKSNDSRRTHELELLHEYNSSRAVNSPPKPTAPSKSNPASELNPTLERDASPQPNPSPKLNAQPLSKQPSEVHADSARRGPQSPVASRPTVHEDASKAQTPDVDQSKFDTDVVPRPVTMPTGRLRSMTITGTKPNSSLEPIALSKENQVNCDSRLQ